MSSIIINVIKVVIALSLGWWFYRDARGRDFSWTFWTLISLIAIFSDLLISIPFLLLMLGLYLAIRPKGKLEKCPHCSKAIHDLLFVCPFCRKNAKKECLSCHEPVPWVADQCPHCKSRAITKS